MKKTFTIFMIMLVMTLVIAVGEKAEVYATGEENPRLIIEEYSISEDEIVPGQIFNLNMKIRNTSQFYDVYTVVVSLSDANDVMAYPIYGESDQIFVDRIYARSSTEVNIRLQAAARINTDIIPVKFKITYNDNYFVEKQSNDTTLYLPVRTSGDLNVVSCAVPEKAQAGTKARISASYANTGSGKLNNVTMKVLAGEQIQNINLYNLDGGSKNMAEAYINCSTLGDMPVKVSFTYENDKGEVFETEDFVYKLEVVKNENVDETVKPPSMIGFRILSVISAIAFIIVAAEIIISIRRKA